MKALRFLLVAVLVAGAFGGGYWYARRGADGAGEAQTGPGGRKILYWHDPMHPSYRSDKPGIAPDCGMRLEPVYADEPGTAAPQGKIAYYYDPEHPEYRSDKPGLNPETGNDLVPAYEQPPPGTINISAERQQLIGVTYGSVEPAHADHVIRAVGRIGYDETRISRVHSRIEGWVERVFVNEVGQRVTAGQSLLTIYSPELLASQQEYLLALRSKGVLAGSTVPGVQSHTSSLIEASRRRLQLFDLSEGQIDTLTRTGQPVQNVALHSPVTGILTARAVYPKMRVTPELELFTVADVSTVWVYADIFEYEAPNIRLGLPAIVRIPGANRTVHARVSQILPEVDPQTRTLKVRLDLPNPGATLRPDMFVDVDFRIHRAAALSVPVEAVFDTGLRKTVYVSRDSGSIEPRQVVTGARIGERVEILSGLSAGERVITSANFLIDSESQMKAAAEGAGASPTGGASTPADGGGAGMGGHKH
jgi:membrane fusion protein, copper/silver efflux system